MAQQKKTLEWKKALDDAIAEAGNQSRLARLIAPDDWESKRAAIAMARTRSINISAEMAAEIAAVTSIPKHRFRPDLWPEGE